MKNFKKLSIIEGFRFPHGTSDLEWEPSALARIGFFD
jgi:hypothetical protein